MNLREEWIPYEIIEKEYPRLSKQKKDMIYNLQKFVPKGRLYLTLNAGEEDSKERVLASFDDIARELKIPEKGSRRALLDLKIENEGLLMEFRGGRTAIFINPKYIELVKTLPERTRYSEFLYTFVNDDDEPIYIGRTNNLYNRISNQHFSGRGHLPVECYNETKRIFTTAVHNKNEAIIYELFYISMYRPKYNIANNSDEQTDEFGVNMDELDWDCVDVNDLESLKNMYLPTDGYDWFRTMFQIGTK